MLWHNHDCNIWYDIRLRWNRRSAKMVLRDMEKIQTVGSFRDWLICLFLTEKIEYSPFHLALILCFTGLLRISNVAIVTVHNFDKSRNAQIKDVTDEGDGLKLLLKWSKSNQFGRDILVLPASRTKILCPVMAWRKYTKEYLGKDLNMSDPLLMLKVKGKLVPLTIDVLRQNLARIFKRAGMENCKYTPHSLRRGGATYFAEEGLSISSIKRHGKWRSDAIYNYLKQMAQKTSEVYRFLKEL